MPNIKSGELCAEVGVNRQRLSQWCQEGLREVAQIRRGWWDRDKAFAWIEERRGDAEAAQSSNPTLVEQRTRLVRAQADWQELRNRREAAELAYLDDMETAIVELFASLLEKGDRAAARGTAEEQAWKRELWHEIRSELRTTARNLVETRSRGRDTRAA